MKKNLTILICLLSVSAMAKGSSFKKATQETVFSIAPEESIVLDPGEYYISFCISEIGQEIKDRWAESESWSDDERFAMYRQDRIHFPLHLKGSYTREGPDQPLGKWGANIGIEVRGIERR